MRDLGTLDKTDLAIFSAVERAPRAPWAALAALIQIDAGTAARRWARLENEGLAWVSCYPLISQNQISAGIEVWCVAGAAREIANTIAHDPQATSVDLMAGSCDILISVIAESHQALSDYVLERLNGLPGVTDVRAHPIIAVHSEGGFSAADGLSPQIAARLPARVPGFAPGPARDNDDIDWQICVALNEDGRRPFSELATIIQISEASVRRRMTRLIESGALRMMVGLASDAAPLPASVWYRMRVAPKELPAVAQSIGSHPNVRAAVSLAGPDNLIVKAAFKHLSNMGAFEAQLNHDHPMLEIADRNVILRAARLRGRVLDAYGYAIEVAPIDIRVPASAG